MLVHAGIGWGQVMRGCQIEEDHLVNPGDFCNREAQCMLVASKARSSKEGREGLAVCLIV